MSTTANPLAGGDVLRQGGLVDKEGKPTEVFQRWLNDLQTRIGTALNREGEVVSTISQPAQESITTDNITDGSGHPLAGGKKAYAALVTSAPTNGQVLQFNGTIWVPVTLPGGTITGVTAGTGLTGGGASGNVSLAIANVAGLTPGSYTNTNLTVNAQGQITAAANGSGGSSYLKGTVTINAGGAASGTFTGTGTVTGATTSMAAIASAPSLVGTCGTHQVTITADVLSANTVEVQVTLPNVGVGWNNITFQVVVFQ